ncbi:flagellar FlbD family protein [Microbacterium suaedae]|uniref:flagellar FlbD family protein n=1 Tax=Microbacterium suaedae TaxID=2067813 RepID=UPI000DA25124|nr:flagellar FlbD family protein [Microbacterium suaedae]
MIIVTRLDGSARFAINPDLIARVTVEHDTYIHMVDGQVYVVGESLDGVIDQIVDFRARVLRRAQHRATDSEA